MAVNGSVSIKQAENCLDNGEFIKYCDSLVERALEAVDIIIKNRPGKNRRR